MEGPLPPCVTGGVVYVEGPLPPSVAGGTAWLDTMGGGSWLIIVCKHHAGATYRVVGDSLWCGHGSTSDFYAEKWIRVCTSHGA